MHAVALSETNNPRMLGRLMQWAHRVRLANKLAIALTFAAIAAGVATYASLTESKLFSKDPRTVLLLLTLDLGLLLALGVLVARRVVGILMTRRRGQAGSRLHVRMAAVFSILAAAPAIVVAVFAAVFFYLGVQAWFSERVSQAVNESLAVAQAYLEEHQQVIRADALAMANELYREA